MDNQESYIEETPVEVEVEVLPLNAGQPPTESDLGSHYKDMSWRDGAEVLADAADFIPGLGSLIKASVGLGDYSPDARLKDKQFKWVIQKVGEIAHKIDILIQKLPPDEQIEAADVAAIINAAMKASEKTADAKKRKLLKNAVVNAFDVDQYQQGMTLRLLKILENVEYGDVSILRRVRKINNEEVYHSDKYEIKSLLKNLQNDNSSGIGDIFYHHLEILDKQNLLVIWNRLGNQPLGIAGQGNVQITDLGDRFLEFVRESGSMSVL